MSNVSIHEKDRLQILSKECLHLDAQNVLRIELNHVG